jgi:hypothetical protein
MLVSINLLSLKQIEKSPGNLRGFFPLRKVKEELTPFPGIFWKQAI